MVLNIVKNDLPASCIAEYVRCVFDNAKVNIKDENAVSGRHRSDRKERAALFGRIKRVGILF